MRKTRREKEVTTDPESMKESGLHEKTTDRPQPGKEMKEMQSTAEARTRLSRKMPLPRAAINQSDKLRSESRQINYQTVMSNQSETIA